MSPATPPLADRRERLDAALAERDLEAIWFARPNSFTWLTGGSNVVDREGSVGVAAAGYDREEGFRVVTDTIEAPRLRDEEVPAEFTIEAADWYADSLAEAVAERSPTPAAADFDVPGFESVDTTSLRQPLADADIDRYRSVGADVVEALELIARTLTPDMTEYEVATDLRAALETRDLVAPVVLVGGSERAQQYRHYTPTDATLGDYALLSVTAHRGGLYASATRTVAFDAPDWLAERHRTAAEVEVSALAATQEVAARDGPAGDVFDAIQEAYAAGGYPDEWTHHHQGGAAGFAGREWIATPDHAARVFAPMAYAWNPTVQGAKSEGTVLVTDDTIEPLTMTEEWPTIDVSAVDPVAGDATLSRPAVLDRGSD
ncbi:M24 family metallopeptidase [Halonotius terrestris]|uniref:M24 family metallopeptidase n=1 Tax=Halonotius terrestris TaxID=2487750 RepID=A0A8J8P724_9EURY|nr:aminopeptidase P family protein [Halonotius terrestris]TQQ80875.1 M24 family metallopeptidase [Halonotius terrestris]